MKEKIKFKITLENKVEYLLIYFIKYMLKMESSTSSLKRCPRVQS